MSAQLRIELRIADVTCHVVQSRFKVCPSRLAEVASIFRLGGGLPGLPAKLFRTHWRAADTENFELRVHAAFTRQVVEARDELSLGQIARSSKDDQDARTSGCQRLSRQLLEGPCVDIRKHNFPPIDALGIDFES